MFSRFFACYIKGMGKSDPGNVMYTGRLADMYEYTASLGERYVILAKGVGNV